MAITQLKTMQDSTSSLDIKKNYWWIIHKYFATKFAIRCWYFILTSWIIIFTLCADIKFYFNNGWNGPIALSIIGYFYTFISFLLLIIGRNMRDHFALMAEMKV